MADDFVPRSLDELALEWPQGLDHISASSVKMIVRCPEQWRQRYVLGHKTPPAAALVLGRADHAAVEHSMTQKIHSYVDLPVSDVKDKFITVVDEEIERDGGYSELEVRDGKKDLIKSVAKKKKTVGDLTREGVQLVSQYHQQISPSVLPVAVEESIDLKTRLPVKITGYIDLVASIGAPGDLPGPGAPMQIIDRKRVGRYGIQAEWRLQAEVYQLARPLPHAWHLSNTSGGGRLHWPDRGETDLIQEVADPERAMLFLEQIVAEVGFLYRKWGPDNPWPTRGKLHPFACGYCGYRETNGVVTCWGWK